MASKLVQRLVTSGFAAAVILGFGGVAEAAQPGSRAAAAALSFDPFKKTAGHNGAAPAATAAKGSSAMQAPIVPTQHHSPVTSRPTTVTIGDATVVEPDSGTVTARFVVTLSQATNFPVTVNFSTSDLSATAGQDYNARTGTVTFQPGQTRQFIDIQVRGDRVREANEHFAVVLNSVSPGTVTIRDNVGIGTILNDD